jgi:hypothetical protein
VYLTLVDTESSECRFVYRDAGIVTPELKWPTTPATLVDQLQAINGPCFGSSIISVEAEFHCLAAYRWAFSSSIAI